MPPLPTWLTPFLGWELLLFYVKTLNTSRSVATRLSYLRHWICVSLILRYSIKRWSSCWWFTIQDLVFPTFQSLVASESSSWICILGLYHIRVASKTYVPHPLSVPRENLHMLHNNENENPSCSSLTKGLAGVPYLLSWFYRNFCPSSRPKSDM